MFKQARVTKTSRKLSASTAALAVASALTLSACAQKQVWVPEFDDARQTLEQVRQDPVVAALATKELHEAEQQFQLAHTAKEQFKSPEVIRFESNLAKIKTLVAQQQARALSANHHLEVAIGQQPMLAEELLAAASPQALTEPSMLAAMPANATVEQQLQALTQQIAALQQQLLQNPGGTTATQIEAAAVADAGAPPLSSASKTLPATSAEPELAAALPKPEVQQQALPTPASIQRSLSAMSAQPTSRGMVLTLGDRYFADGTARLWSGRAARHLDNVASVLTTNPTLNLNIEAHTDNSSGSDVSHDLSVNRAIALKSALVLRGVDGKRIHAIGYGASKPIMSNDLPLGRLQNRRVELIFPDTAGG